ncbi:MAG: CDP-diacylglycerol--glycerol-3-phosphate 3-phosphatidyltransferase [Planctomycetaceae bacterium]|jgi:CDP-diacylglycerol--glycerol-3-phosphate 3-phosphatidyltransferase|nr:CDP-diacylglycerol--glycerol-3-phosphate 3-phosphatidyltransferase [Planctomycetaceae bacterium]
MNVPNILTLFRVFFAIAVFYFTATKAYDFCLLFFILATLTDFVDGWWARRFKQITIFGRVMDPFADKFLICGVFVYLVAIPELTSDAVGYPAWLMLQPWMVVVILGRELLVTSLRSFVEASGGDFSAKWIGKWKMAFQCLAVISCFVYLAGGAERVISTTHGDLTAEVLISDFFRPDAVAAKDSGSVFAGSCDFILGTKYWRNIVFYTMLVSLWLTVAITFISGLDYCINAARMIRKKMEERKSMEKQ